MRYSDSIESSAERLRLALPLMAKHGVAINPENYTVWYEYVSGTNEGLRREIDSRLHNGQRVDGDATERLFQKYFSDSIEHRLEPMQKAVREIVSLLSSYVSTMDDHASKYSDALARYGEELRGNLGVGDIQRILDALVDHTQSVRDTQSSLRHRLNESTAELAKLRSELESAKREAATDPLTGLINRKGLEAAIEQALSELEPAALPPCLLMIDIDHFKKVNDTHGHILGDKVLRLVGSTLRQCTRGRDTVARNGGEEFSVLLPDTPLQGAKKLAHQLCRSIASGRVMRMDNRQAIGQITVSIGVTAHQNGETPAQLVQRADEALYQSKRSGRNRVTVNAPLTQETDPRTYALHP